ncbi:hypothetical protein CTEN210_18410 [Chaetoceros tenuissimus]|uniref:1-alkyl-2-acetylglycerophosphocholine esterase n=1 Tax=Chaetoceros tenuissimus TaxID=426638 RepID=A0AAD3DFY6_9STRA|nr:hypothetical protein CTEN210_18410 [Chaetoceros tenuissimus]
MTTTRKGFIHRFTFAFLATASFLQISEAASPRSAFAFMPQTSSPSSTSSEKTADIIAYQDLKLNIPQFGINVPVATWYKPDEELTSTELSNEKVLYSHRISVKRIGSLLAKLDFIPAFVAKDFQLEPTTKINTIYGKNGSFPKDRPVVLLAHGFLGSRFDLSHLAEELASEGFIVFSAEYPESLSSSYDRIDGLDRTLINQELLKNMESEWNVKASSYGIVGHSLGCGTVTSTGDASWTRVTIAGPPVRRDGVDLGGNILAITSLNDGLVAMNGGMGRLQSMIPSDFIRLQETTMMDKPLPSKGIVIFDRDDGPNHISFLAGNANDAMVSFLSPLLPVAQALSIPVLDFDRYKESRDSKETADVVIPLISTFLRQYMM